MRIAGQLGQIFLRDRILTLVFYFTARKQFELRKVLFQILFDMVWIKSHESRISSVENQDQYQYCLVHRMQMSY